MTFKSTRRQAARRKAANYPPRSPRTFLHLLDRLAAERDRAKLTKEAKHD